MSQQKILHRITKANQKLSECLPRDDIAIMSMDAAALFPSLNIKDILNSIWKLIVDTELELQTIDIQELAKYLAVTYKHEELVKNKVISCIPKRQVEIDGRCRREPSIEYLDSDSYNRTRRGVTEMGSPNGIGQRPKNH